MPDIFTGGENQKLSGFRNFIVRQNPTGVVGIRIQVKVSLLKLGKYWLLSQVRN
jgi:hypothetical protein